MLKEKAPFDPVQATRWLKVAAGTVLFVAGFNLMVGLASLLVKTEGARPVEVGYETPIAGVLFLILGIFVWRQSAIALGIAVALLTGEGIWRVVEVWGRGGGGDAITFGGFILRLLLIFLMLRGLAAIRTLKQTDYQPRTLEERHP